MNIYRILTREEILGSGGDPQPSPERQPSPSPEPQPEEATLPEEMGSGHGDLFRSPK